MKRLEKILLFWSLSSLFAVANGATISSKISISSDDAEESLKTGYLNLHSTDLEMIYENKEQNIGLRFQNINIPKNAIIQKAYIQFQTDEVSEITTDLIIYGEKIVSAPTFDKTKKRDISNRVKTISHSTWSVPKWSIVGERGVAQRSSDISSIVQEIINQDKWSSGNAMAFIITGRGKRTAESYNGDPDGAPTLYIEYSTENSTLNSDIIKRSSSDTNLRDIEAITYDSVDNALWVADDDKKQIYKIDLNTQKTTEVIDEFNSIKRGSDIKAVAYNRTTDTLFAFGRNNKVVFRLTRDSDGDFRINDFKQLEVSVNSAIFINNKLYISYYGLIREYDYENNQISDNNIFSYPYAIHDMAYNNGYLWIVTENNMVHKIDFNTMSIIESLDMSEKNIADARGVEIINNKLYVADGSEDISGDLNHAIYIFDLNSSSTETDEDTTPPNITLNGSSSLSLNLGENYTELGAIAMDNIDGNLAVSISGSVDTSTVGRYTITYSATDSSNNRASTTRTIIVNSDSDEIDSDIIKRSSSDTNLRDIEAITYDSVDNALWVADDDKKQIYKIDLNTQKSTEVIDEFNSIRKGSDIKAVAYNRITDTLYAFGRDNKTIFKLTRDGSGNFKIVDSKELDVAVYASVFIDNKLYVAYSGVIQEYDYEENMLCDKLFSSNQDIYDMAYANGYLWILTENNKLNKINLHTKSLEKVYDMLDRGITDARGVEIVGDKIYIADGADNISGDLNHAIYIFDMDISSDLNNDGKDTSLSHLEIIKRDFQIPFEADRADMEAITYIPSDNAIWVTNDDGKHFIYRLNLDTNKVDDYVDGFVEGFDINIKAQDLEAIAYDINHDTLYVSSGKCGRDIAIFKLTRNNNGGFEIVDAYKLDNPFTSMVFVNGQLYVAYKGRELRKYNFETRELSDIIYQSKRELYDMTYHDGILWVTTDEKRLVKIDWNSMKVLDSFDMIENSVEDPRGVTIVDNKLYISDGADWIDGELKHAMHVFKIP